MKRLLPMLLVLVLLGACTSTTKKETKTEASSTKQTTSSSATSKDPKFCGEDTGNGTCGISSKGADMSAYENFDDPNNVFVKKSMDEVLQLFEEKKSAILYFGYPDCPWCVEALPILDETAKKAEQNVWYIQTRDAKKKLLYSEAQKKKLLPQVENFLKKDDEGNLQLFVPFVVVVKDGKAVSGHIGTQDSHDAHKRKMNAKEQKALMNIYEDMFTK